MKTRMDELIRKLKFRMPKQRSNSWLYNRWILYAMFFIAIVNLYLLGVHGEYNYVAIFILVGFLTSFFSKNMMVILFIAVAITNVLKIGMSSKRYEGMEDKDATTEKKTETETVEKEPETTTEEKPAKKSTKSNDAKIQEKKDEIIEDGKELLDVQTKIVDGFQQIEPYMKKAEGLAAKIEDSATIITKLNE